MNGKESIPAIHSGPKAPVTWPHLIEPRRGRVGKARRVRRSKRAKTERQEPSTPFCKSLGIHENEVARGHAETVSQSEASILIFQKEACQKMRGQSEQQGAPRVLTEVNYY